MKEARSLFRAKNCQCYYTYWDENLRRLDYERRDFRVKRLLVCKAEKAYSFAKEALDTEAVFYDENNESVPLFEVSREEFDLLLAGVEKLGYKETVFKGIRTEAADGYRRGTVEFIFLPDGKSDGGRAIEIDHFHKTFSEGFASDYEMDLGVDCFGDELGYATVSKAVFFCILEGLEKQGYKRVAWE